MTSPQPTLQPSTLASLASLPPPQRAKILARLTPSERAALLDFAWEWPRFARTNQLPPEGDWLVWLLLAGRGFGKTRTGAEFIRHRIEAGAKAVVIAAPTSADVRDICVLGESGLLSVFPPHRRPEYEPSKRRVTFAGGASAILVSADEPERFRGLQSDTVWADELASWRYPDAWTQLMLGCRLGDPRVVVTTTPKPIPLIRELVAAPTTHVTRGSTYDNRDNLAARFFSAIVSRYEGTRTGRQELLAEILDDVEGAIVTHAMIDAARVVAAPEPQRIVVGIDPAVTSGEDADETGIVVAAKGMDGDAYVLEDLTCRVSPDAWARRAIDAYHRHGADRIVVERNNGGDLVEATLRQVDRNVPVRTVVATKGKHVRFEPVGALYEQGRVHHVGTLGALEDQVCAFTAAGYEGGSSPDRADALVWAMTDLMLRTGVQWGDLYGPA